jgi:hypothetical protein
MEEQKEWKHRCDVGRRERYLNTKNLSHAPDLTKEFKDVINAVRNHKDVFPSLADYDRARADLMEENLILYRLVQSARGKGIKSIEPPKAKEIKINQEFLDDMKSEVVSIMVDICKDVGLARSNPDFIDCNDEGFQMLDFLQTNSTVYKHLSNQEAVVRGKQLLMKKYQTEFERNREIYPELNWVDLGSALEEHRQEWGDICECDSYRMSARGTVLGVS